MGWRRDWGTRTTVGVLIVGATAIAVVASAAGCSEGAAPNDGAGEKVAATSAALIQKNPTAPYGFPTQNAKFMDCRDKWTGVYTVPASSPGSLAWQYTENYVAYPVTFPTTDSNATAYSHHYQYGDCSGTNPLACQLENDFFGIPNANGYKYKVAQLTQGVVDPSGRVGLVQSSRNWYVQGVGSVAQGWSMTPPSNSSTPPWCPTGGCPAGTTRLEPTSHPPYGTDYRSADWLQLWNLAWTYSYAPHQDGPVQGPYNGDAGPSTQYIESEHHQCAFIYVCPGGTQSCATNADCPSGQICQPDAKDPGYTCWAPCYNPTKQTFDADPKSLVLQDFFVAMEKHDPDGNNW